LITGCKNQGGGREQVAFGDVFEASAQRQGIGSVGQEWAPVPTYPSGFALEGYAYRAGQGGGGDGPTAVAPQGHELIELDVNFLGADLNLGVGRLRLGDLGWGLVFGTAGWSRRQSTAVQGNEPSRRSDDQDGGPNAHKFKGTRKVVHRIPK